MLDWPCLAFQLSSEDQELRLSEEIGKYVLENPLRRMTKAVGD